MISATCLHDLRVAINSLVGLQLQVGLSALKSEVTSKASKVKLNQAARCQLRSFGQINDLISSIHLQCMSTVQRFLAVHVSWRTLQSLFTEQFFSKSRFTDTKNCRSRLRENKLPTPHIMFDDVLDRKQCSFPFRKHFTFRSHLKHGVT